MSSRHLSRESYKQDFNNNWTKNSSLWARRRIIKYEEEILLQENQRLLKWAEKVRRNYIFAKFTKFYTEVLINFFFYEIYNIWWDILQFQILVRSPHIIFYFIEIKTPCLIEYLNNIKLIIPPYVFLKKNIFIYS